MSTVDTIRILELEERINRARARWPSSAAGLSWQVSLLAEVYGTAIHARRHVIALAALPEPVQRLLRELGA